MTLQIDSSRLRRERRNRAWTQQHLADASGLGIRTIQRIEKGGTAAPETVQAIAACFGLDVSDLIVKKPERASLALSGWAARLALALVVVITASLASFLSTRQATAHDVLLKYTTIAMTAEGENFEHEGMMVVADGEATQFEMRGAFRIEVMPSILEDQRVFIAMKVFAEVDGQYELVSEPSLIVLNEREAMIDLELATGPADRIRVEILPSIETP
jgi:transcriptional regulator with XRE-family HTH domain